MITANNIMIVLISLTLLIAVMMMIIVSIKSIIDVWKGKFTADEASVNIVLTMIMIIVLYHVIQNNLTILKSYILPE